VPGLLHGVGHANQISHIFTVFTGDLDATKANAANLVAKLQVETADKQQLSTKLADLGPINLKTELEAKVPSGCHNFWIGTTIFLTILTILLYQPHALTLAHSSASNCA